MRPVPVCSACLTATLAAELRLRSSCSSPVKKEPHPDLPALILTTCSSGFAPRLRVGHSLAVSKPALLSMDATRSLLVFFIIIYLILIISYCDNSRLNISEECSLDAETQDRHVTHNRHEQDAHACNCRRRTNTRVAVQAGAAVYAIVTNKARIVH